MGIKNKPVIGVLPLGRPTFDVPFAEANLAAMLAALESTGCIIRGPRTLLMDASATREAIAGLVSDGVDVLLALQVTFTDALAVREAAEAFRGPLALWAIPEPRLGGRLRLNSFCGLNLAVHALGLAGREFGWLYAAPDVPDIEASLDALLAGRRTATASQPMPASGNDRRGVDAARSLAGTRIGRIGRHPDGFDTCRYDAGRLAALAGVSVTELEVGDLFARGQGMPADRIAGARTEAAALAPDLDTVDQGQLSRSLALKPALDDLKQEGRFDAFAIRCWPETFTEYGGAVCGSVAMMGEARVPCACEADVYGALSALLLQRVAGAPAFLTDLVDVDTADDTAVVWHCGQAPASMADADVVPHATIHTNRKMPLLFEFPLKPGRVTLFRISQARGKTFVVIGGAEMLKRPMAFTGTSGVLRFDSGAQPALDRLIGSTLEHHLALAYGDHRDALGAAAATLGLPVLEL